MGPGRHTNWIAATMVVIGQLQFAYGVWAARSDAVAADRYRRSEEFKGNWTDSVFVSGGRGMSASSRWSFMAVADGQLTRSH